MSQTRAWTYSQLPLDSVEARERWRALWEQSPQRSVFSSPPYASSVAETFGLDCRVHFVHDGNHKDAVGALIFSRTRGPYRMAVIPPFTPHSGLIFGAMPDAASVHQRRTALDVLIAELERQFHALRFQLHPSIEDVRTFTWHGWNVRPYYTYIANLSGATSLLDNWSRRTRRTARNESGRFKVCEDPNAAIEITDLYLQSLQRQQHRVAASSTQITLLIEKLQACRLARLYTIRPSDSTELTGAIAMLVSGREAFYWLGGSAPGSSMTILLGTVLPMLYEDGIRSVDYVGANTPSIAEFKRQFGGTLVTYYGVEKHTRPELRLLDFARALRPKFLA